MGEQHRDLVEDVDLARAGLPPRRGNAHHDIPQHAGGKRGKFAFLHREREDVCWAIFVTIDFVQFPNAFVVG